MKMVDASVKAEVLDLLFGPPGFESKRSHATGTTTGASTSDPAIAKCLTETERMTTPVDIPTMSPSTASGPASERSLVTNTGGFKIPTVKCPCKREYREPFGFCKDTRTGQIYMKVFDCSFMINSYISTLLKIYPVWRLPSLLPSWVIQSMTKDGISFAKVELDPWEGEEEEEEEIWGK